MKRLVEVAELLVVYTDRGVSAGMRYGIDRAARRGIAIEWRSLEGQTVDV